MLTCSQCGTQLPEDANVCTQCGTPVAKAPAAEPAPAEKIKKKLTKPVIIGIAAAVAVIALVVILIAALGGGAPDFVLYNSDGELYLANGGSYKAIYLADDDEYSDFSSFSKDGKQFLARGEDGELLLVTVGKEEPVELASDYASVYPSEDFKTFTYTKDGAIYQVNAKGNATQGDKKIEGKVASIFSVSPDGKIIYFQDEDGAFCVKNGKKESEEILDKEDYEKASIQGFGKGKKSIYYIDGDNVLCKKELGKDAVELAEDILNVYGLANKRQDGYAYNSDNKFYVMQGEVDEEKGTTKRTFCYFDGKKVVELTDEFKDAYASVDISGRYEAGVVSFTEMKEDKAETTYYMVKGNKASEWDEDIARTFGYSLDGKYYYFTDKVNAEKAKFDLYRVKISANPGEAELVDEDVFAGAGDNYFEAVIILDSGKVAYFKEVNLEKNKGELYVSGKLVSEDVCVSSGITENRLEKTFYFFADYNAEKGRGTLCEYTGKCKIIAEDVYSASYTAGGDILYLLDYDKGEGDLYVTGKKNPIAEEVSEFQGSYDYLFSYYYEY